MTKLKRGTKIKITKVEGKYGNHKVGDIVEIGDYVGGNDVYEIDNEGGKLNDTSRIAMDYYNYIILNEDKYESMERRIDEVEGWTKEADDIINEITLNRPVCITIKKDGGEPNTGEVVIERGRSSVAYDMNGDIVFPYYSQCEKNSAFKKALRWLLKKSDLQTDYNDKQKKVRDIEEKIKKLQETLNILKGVHDV